MRALLIFLWEHHGESFSEYAIATEALGRAPGFDPKLDSTVRVQVARLRTKLKEFYETAGDAFPLRLSIPLGRHELQWVYQPSPKPAAPGLIAIPERYRWGIALAGLALLTVCVALLVQVRTLRVSLPPRAAPMPRFWRSFLMPGKSTTIVVPSPLFFFWPSHQVYVRDLEISDFTNWPSSPFLAETAQKWGASEHAQAYVGAMEMTAGVRLLQYLENAGQPVQLIESRKFPAESFAAQNTIFLGMPRTAGYLSQMVDKANFYIASVSPDVIRSATPIRESPRSTRKSRIQSIGESLRPSSCYCPRPEHTRILLLLGRNPTSITSMLLSLEGLKQLDEQWAKSGSPDAWEMVIQAEIYRDAVLKVTPLACRSIPPTFWK